MHTGVKNNAKAGNVTLGSMVADFRERWIPNEEEKYKKYMYMLVLIKIIALAILSARLAGIGSLAVDILKPVYIVARLLLSIIIFYIMYKARVWHFLLKQFLCLLVSVVCISIAAHCAGPLVVPMFILFAIYHNRNRFKVYAKYKQYTVYVLATGLISSAVKASGWLYFSKLAAADYLMFRMAASLILFIPVYMLWNLMKNEIAKGRTFIETMRIMSLMGVAWVFMLLCWASVIPVKFLSADWIYGYDDDFMPLRG